MDDTQVLTELLNYEDSFDYFEENREYLRKQYKNNFLAIVNREVIDFAPTIEELREKLEEKGIDIGKIFVEFLPEKEPFMII